MLGEALPFTRLTREGLMEDLMAAVEACSMVATALFKHLKPSVSFAAGTKPGDNIPYCINLLIKKPQEAPERELTKLELRQREHAEAGEEVPSAEAVTEPDTKDTELDTQTDAEEKPKKNNKLFSWFSKLFKGKKI